MQPAALRFLIPYFCIIPYVLCMLLIYCIIRFKVRKRLLLQVFIGCRNSFLLSYRNYCKHAEQNRITAFFHTPGFIRKDKFIYVILRGNQSQYMYEPGIITTIKLCCVAHLYISFFIKQ